MREMLRDRAMKTCVICPKPKAGTDRYCAMHRQRITRHGSPYKKHKPGVPPTPWGGRCWQCGKPALSGVCIRTHNDFSWPEAVRLGWVRSSRGNA